MRERRQRGVTYVEVLATITIMLVLAGVVIPTAKATRKKAKEIELRAALRQMREAIDKFHARCDDLIVVGDGKKVSKNAGDGTCAEPTYPPTLEDLVDGVPLRTTGEKMKLLREIPTDPMNDNKPDWGLRCYKSRPDDTSWCGSDVYDVYSKSQAEGSDGRKYSEW